MNTVKNLEALPVHNGWARFVIFLFGDPHLLEGGQRSKDGTSDPYGVFPLWWCNDLDLHCGWCKAGDLLLHAVGDARVHGGASRQYGIGIQVLPDVDITFHNTVVGGLVDTSRFHS